MAGARKPGPIGVNPNEGLQWMGVGAPRCAISISGPVGTWPWVGPAPSQKVTPGGKFAPKTLGARFAPAPIS
jgi:hypothetical protein